MGNVKDAGKGQNERAGAVPVLPGDRFADFRDYLRRVGFRFEERPHQVFLARSGKLVVSLYASGKVVIGGGDRQLEREVRWYLAKLGAAGEALPEKLAEVRGKARIGTDEAGKGDYFGPLVVAGALVDGSTEKELLALGVRDSKRMSDGRVMTLERDIKRALGAGGWEVLRIDPARYNSLQAKMGSVNRMLAWGHARVIENLLKGHPDCALAVVDEFSARSLQAALMEWGKRIRVVQATRGERDVAVAAASILARAELLRRLGSMGREYGAEFPRGASAVEGFAREFIAKRGREALTEVAKVHFRTTEKVLEG
jgi:ribonuclease HIII